MVAPGLTPMMSLIHVYILTWNMELTKFQYVENYYFQNFFLLTFQSVPQTKCMILLCCFLSAQQHQSPFTFTVRIRAA